MLARIQREAQETLERARRERERMLSRPEIDRAASSEAERVIDTAKAQAREIRLEAEHFVDGKLASLEVGLQKMIALVQSASGSFTDFADPRWILGQDFLQLLQDEKPAGRFPEQMTGLFNPAEWGVHVRGSCIFLKRAAAQPGKQYPDYGCNFEVFTNPDFLELETLGPVVDLQRVFGNPANPKLLMDDGLHPNIEGQRAIVKALVERLTE